MWFWYALYKFSGPGNFIWKLKCKHLIVIWPRTDLPSASKYYLKFLKYYLSVWNLSRIRLCCMKFWALCLHPQCQTCMMLLEKFNGFLLNTFFGTLHLPIIDQILLSFSVFIYICIMILTFLKTWLSIVGSYYCLCVIIGRREY